MPEDGITRRQALCTLAAAAAAPLGGCGAFIYDDDVQPGELSGRVLVEWVGEDVFVYRASPGPPLSFRPSFMRTPIVPGDMFTDGGSIPRLLWAIPGLSPWALGPAYIIHDWILEVHRCGRPAPPEVRAITFEQTAVIMAQVGRALIEAGLVRHDRLPEIVWALRTNYARHAWDHPPHEGECRIPRARARGRRVVDFTIPPRRGRAARTFSGPGP